MGINGSGSGRALHTAPHTAMHGGASSYREPRRREKMVPILSPRAAGTDGVVVGAWPDGGDGADPRIGTRAGQYLLTRVLGTGGMGRVYVGEHVDLPGARVAVKTLLPASAANPTIAGMFRVEARASAAIDHPRIVKVIDVGRFPDGQPWLVMELLVGQDVGQLVRKRGPLPLPLALSILAQACDGIDAAHARGIVHRDLKPDHLFVEDPGDEVKILDFGVAKVDDLLIPGAVRIERGQAVGSPGFMAPEQACGYEVDRRADVFSLGAIAYWMLVGERPFPGRSLSEYTVSAMRMAAPDPCERRPEVPRPWGDVIMRALRPDPRERPPTAIALAQRLLDLPGADDLLRRVAPVVLVEASEMPTAKQRPQKRD